MSFQTIVLEMQQDRIRKVEEYLRLRIKPRPFWMSKRMHRWILSKLIYLEELR